MVKREEADNTVVFVNAIAKVKYNAKYKDIFLDVNNKVFFILYYNYKV